MQSGETRFATSALLYMVYESNSPSVFGSTRDNKVHDLPEQMCRK